MLVWLMALLAFPAITVALSLTRLHEKHLRWSAVMCGAGLLVWSGALAVGQGWASDGSLSGSVSSASGAGLLFRITPLSSVLLPFSAVLWLLAVGVTPRGALDRTGLRRTALGTMTTLLTFMTDHPLVLAFAWVASVVVFLAGLRGPAERDARHVAAAYLGISCILMVSGTVLLGLGEPVESPAILLILLAAFIRKGIFPLHAWVPHVFERGRLGPAILFGAPQVGAYVTAVLVVPRAGDDLLRLVALLALGTSVYGAALALIQRDARRACGYLFVSQSALVMAGLDCTSPEALCGGLCVWLSSGIGFAGLSRCLLVLEARRGRLSLTMLNGGYERMPLLAVSFLVMGLACTGFPGTFGFVGEELLVNGAVGHFPLMGFTVVVAGALTGLTVFRMYLALFTGRADPSIHLRPRGRELAAFGLLAALLIGTGIAPGGLVKSRAQAAHYVLSLRGTHQDP